MRIFKNHPLLSLANGYLIDAPQPSNLSYLWNFGSLLAFCLVIQIVTGVTLAMHYNPSVAEAFNSVEHIMRDVNNGWLIRYLHSNTASAFFFLVYLHVGRGLYYGPYKAAKTLVLIIGFIALGLMIYIPLLGYILPYGTISLRGAIYITNLISAIPWVGQDIVEFLWGGFTVNNSTLKRFFFFITLPFILGALVLMHLIALHHTAVSGSPLGLSGNSDRLPLPSKGINLIKKFLFIIFLSASIALIIYFIVKIISSLTPILYCIDSITEAKIFLENKIAKIQESYSYWKTQCILAELEYKKSLISSTSDIQSQMLQAKKECEANLNTDSHLLRRLNEKLASGEYTFKTKSILGKRECNS